MNRFVRRHLDPVDRMGEVLFGVIMALGFTAAVRLGHEEADSRALFVGILGCNVAWGIVDGVMYVLAALFERGREARVVHEVVTAPSEEAARERVAEHLADDPLLSRATDDERRRFHGWVAEMARRSGPPNVRLRADDLLGAAAVALVILMATAPMLVPYLLLDDPNLAVRVSHGIGLAMLFLVGAKWGASTGTGVWRVGLGVTFVGAVLVSVTVALGG